MLSIFPWLFNYSQAASFILRIALAIILINTSSFILPDLAEKQAKLVKIIKSVSALCLILGLFIQPVALLLIIMLGINIIRPSLDMEKKLVSFLLMTVALSLMLLGPGLFSIDLPL
ncbi:MAG: hypothetical protein AB1643_01670 [Patescibacteria group bacterium]